MQFTRIVDFSFTVKLSWECHDKWRGEYGINYRTLSKYIINILPSILCTSAKAIGLTTALVFSWSSIPEVRRKRTEFEIPNWFYIYVQYNEYLRLISPLKFLIQIPELGSNWWDNLLWTSFIYWDFFYFFLFT